MKKFIISLFSLVIFSIGLTAQDLNEVERASNNEHEHFGWDMALDGDWLVIGSPHSETDGGADAGRVLVYQRNGDGWDETQELTDADGNAFQNFGFSIDISGDVLVVGAIGTFQHGPFTGRAYVYELTEGMWQLATSLEAEDGAPGTYFGHSVATNGDRIVVGAMKADGTVAQSGAVYDFERVNGAWAFANKLTPDDGVMNDNFGFSVDISEQNTVVVGAPNQADFLEQSGAAYIFEYDGTAYAQTARLKAFNRTERDFLGTAVSISGTDVVAGAFLADGFSNNTGSVYFFSGENGQWLEKQQIAYQGSGLNDYFGKTLDISPLRLVIGAPKANSSTATDVGQSYYYVKDGDTWSLRQVLDDPEASDHNFFGASVAISDFDLAVSARMDDAHGNDGGTVYAAGLGQVTSTEDEIVLDRAIELVNYPNPTQQQVTISYKLFKASRVALEVFDNSGQPIKQLLPEAIQQAGNQQVEWNLTSWNGSRVTNGLYFYKLSIDGAVITRKIIVSR